MTAIEWACPNCGAPHGKCGRGTCTASLTVGCDGFCCDCLTDTDTNHGTSFADACEEARCYHCGWCGVFPMKPRGLQAWERKALDAGWAPPEARARELGIGAEPGK